MKNKIILYIAAWAVLATGCKDEFMTVTAPDGVPVDRPGMGLIVSSGLPADVGINLLDAAVAHRYKVKAGEDFNIDAGQWSAAAYTNASALGETKGNIISLPVSADGEMSQVVFSAGVTPFTIIEDQRTDIRIGTFHPMTREIQIPIQVIYNEAVVIEKIEVIIYGVAPQVDASKPFGNIHTTIGAMVTARAPGDTYIRSTVQAGVATFNSPGISPQHLGMAVHITADGQVYNMVLENQSWAAVFNGGSSGTAFTLEPMVLKYSLDETGGSITPWVPDEEVEIPGI